ncbi:armadillo-type protein [Mycena vulgaris]|nr:armadillo-type protein [Mycena vulgaris]
MLATGGTGLQGHFTKDFGVESLCTACLPVVASANYSSSTLSHLSFFSDKNLEVIEVAAYALCKVSQWPDGAQAAIDAKVLDYPATLLGSPEAGIRQNTCFLVGQLAMHTSTAPVVLELGLCGQLISLDENLEVIEGAAYALCHVSQWPEAAQATVDAKVLDYTATLLGSSEARIRRVACLLVGHNENLEVITCATDALDEISQWPDGAQAAVDAKVLDYMATLLGSSEARICQYTCFLVGKLAMHASTAPAVLELGLCRQLVSLDENLEAIKGAAYALCQVSQWPEGAQAAVDAKVLDHVTKLFQSHQVGTLGWMCELVGHLVSHNFTVSACLAAAPWMWLLPCLHSDTDFVRADAASALAEMSQQPDGVAALADTAILDNLETLNQSWEDEIQVHIQGIKGHQRTVLPPKFFNAPIPVYLSVVKDWGVNPESKTKERSAKIKSRETRREASAQARETERNKPCVPAVEFTWRRLQRDSRSEAK